MRSPIRSILRLRRDDSGSGSPAGLPPGWLKRLRESERGTVTVYFLSTGFLFYMACSLVWNTGNVLSRRVQVQNVADTAAYSSSVWISRCMNMVTATNALILQNASAHIAARGAVDVVEGVQRNWLQAFLDCQGDPACQTAVLNQIQIEQPAFLSFYIQSYFEAKLAIDNNTFLDRIVELHDFQRSIIANIPFTIEEHRQELERLNPGVIVYLTKPGDFDGFIEPPLREGTQESFTPALVAKFYGVPGMTEGDNNLPTRANFNQFQAIGRALDIWDASTASEMLAIIDSHGALHHVLTTQNGAIESGPASIEERAAFSVIALTSMPVGGTEFMMPGYFSSGPNITGRVITYAQGETYNGIDQWLATTGVTVPYPWRVWSTWGWNWQPRLARGDQMSDTIESDFVVRGTFMEMGFDARTFSFIPAMCLH